MKGMSAAMKTERIFPHEGVDYIVDELGFLVNPETWDDNFAKGMAQELKMPELTDEHWKVIRYIRSVFERTKECPLIYTTCRANGLSLKDLRNLFPTGYQRGACKLAGIGYQQGEFAYYYWDNTASQKQGQIKEKTYLTDVRGFLTDYTQWDEYWAISKSKEMKMREELNQEHWKIIHYLREQFVANRTIPTVFDLSDRFDIDLEELERLFPDGYHRGAVKLAGLRL